MAIATFDELVDFRTVSFFDQRFDAEQILRQTGGSFTYGGTVYDSRLVLRDTDVWPVEVTTYFGTGFTFAGTNLTGGTIQGLQIVGGTEIGAFVSGLSVSAAALNAASLTAGLTDDRAFLRLAFAGNDRFTLSSAGDWIFSGAGNDSVIGNAGNDSVFGEGGNDTLLGNTGNDLLDGGASNDLLNGGAGNDVLVGGTGFDTLRGATDNDRLNGGADNDALFGDAGNDTLTGGAGNDTLVGGTGADIFDFRAGAGTDRITGFQDGSDRIRFAISSPTEPIAIQDLGADARVRIEDVTIILVNFDHTLLSLDDFLILPA